ncbi:unnamed protein product [Zymoseptoria tritici ST99CH_3D7]|uniref:SRP9 domain-containing protein n=1 Tax=Zymoseptoria tritici (strain ST99CH_3D7) TaxID=1276538 RepID=A0A1X7RLQ0_ZYMT9|nr:unnamed protein product [Zymoseptoria tritici ST99CH_3D7]
MPVLSSSEEWQRQSSLLLQARPTTTRITTKYNIPNLDSPKYQKTKKRKRETDGEDKDAPAAPRVPRATLTLKTYDPESGVVLKFKTDRAAEVGRLIGSLGRVGRYMAALPEKEEAQDTVPEDVPAIEQAADSTLPTSDSKPQGGSDGFQQKRLAGSWSWSPQSLRSHSPNETLRRLIHKCENSQ